MEEKLLTIEQNEIQILKDRIAVLEAKVTAIETATPIAISP